MFPSGLVLFAIALLGIAQPASAQLLFDIAGFWDQPAARITSNQGFEEDNNERGGGPELVDYLGLPLNDEARARALAYDSALLGVPEHVCMRHPSTYSFWGPARLRITADMDENLEVVAYHVGGTFRRADRTIWMDGRPHPSAYAPHTWAGFTTGEWRGSTLVTTTTHIKWGWIRRNGVPSSDQATVVTYYTRNEGILTIAWIVYDPVYLTEPFMRSVDFIAAPGGVAVAPAGLEPKDRLTSLETIFLGGATLPLETLTYSNSQCMPREEIALPDQHRIPHFLEGTNPFVGERAKALGIPVEATLGGAATMLPEYKDRLKP